MIIMYFCVTYETYILRLRKDKLIKYINGIVIT